MSITQELQHSSFRSIGNSSLQYMKIIFHVLKRDVEAINELAVSSDKQVDIIKKSLSIGFLLGKDDLCVDLINKIRDKLSVFLDDDDFVRIFHQLVDEDYKLIRLISPISPEDCALRKKICLRIARINPWISSDSKFIALIPDRSVSKQDLDKDLCGASKQTLALLTADKLDDDLVSDPQKDMLILLRSGSADLVQSYLSRSPRLEADIKGLDETAKFEFFKIILTYSKTPDDFSRLFSILPPFTVDELKRNLLFEQLILMMCKRLVSLEPIIFLTQQERSPFNELRLENKELMLDVIKRSKHLADRIKYFNKLYKRKDHLKLNEEDYHDLLTNVLCEEDQESFLEFLVMHESFKEYADKLDFKIKQMIFKQTPTRLFQFLISVPTFCDFIENYYIETFGPYRLIYDDELASHLGTLANFHDRHFEYTKHQLKDKLISSLLCLGVKFVFGYFLFFPLGLLLNIAALTYGGLALVNFIGMVKYYAREKPIADRRRMIAHHFEHNHQSSPTNKLCLAGEPEQETADVQAVNDEEAQSRKTPALRVV